MLAALSTQMGHQTKMFFNQPPLTPIKEFPSGHCSGDDSNIACLLSFSSFPLGFLRFNSTEWCPPLTREKYSEILLFMLKTQWKLSRDNDCQEVYKFLKANEKCQNGDNLQQSPFLYMTLGMYLLGCLVQTHLCRCSAIIKEEGIFPSVIICLYHIPSTVLGVESRYKEREFSQASRLKPTHVCLCFSFCLFCLSKCTYSYTSRDCFLSRVITQPSPDWLPPRIKYAGANILVLVNIFLVSS